MRNMPKSEPSVKGLVIQPLLTLSILTLRIMTNDLAANGNHSPRMNLLATKMSMTASDPGDPG